MRNLTHLRSVPLRRLALATMSFCALMAVALPAHAQDQTQDPANERRCTGQLRASVDERIAACTALIDSGRYQPVNLAILHDNRGSAYRVKGDPTSARKDFDD